MEEYWIREHLKLSSGFLNIKGGSVLFTPPFQYCCIPTVIQCKSPSQRTEERISLWVKQLGLTQLLVKLQFLHYSLMSSISPFSIKFSGDTHLEMAKNLVYRLSWFNPSQQLSTTQPFTRSPPTQWDGGGNWKKK